MRYIVRWRCGHRIAIIRRAGEDDDDDHDCVLGVRAYGLRGENRDRVPTEQSSVDCVIHLQCSRPGINTNNSVCVLRRGHQRRQIPLHQDDASSSGGLGVLPAVQYEIYDHPGVRVRLKVRLQKAEAIDTLI